MEVSVSYLRHSKTELNCHDLRMYSAQLRKYAQKNMYLFFIHVIFIFQFIYFIFHSIQRREEMC